VNILIIGLGSIAKKHIVALKQLNIIAKIYALRSKPNSEDLEGVINIYDLNNIDLFFDFAIISNSTNLHFKYDLCCMQFKIPPMYSIYKRAPHKQHKEN